jgi:hypothetical protein
MSLTVNQIGDNPQQPGIYAEAYIPDQLIAGNMKLVTDSVTITGAAVLQRGSVLGATALGTVAASTGTAFATGSIVVAAVPTAADTVTIGGTPVTFVAANPTGNQVLIGATTAATAQSLAAFLIGATDVNLIKFTYSVSGSTVTTNAAATGTGGNALTLATSDSTAFTVSGATLSGGVANTGNATVGTMSTGPATTLGNYTAVCVTATTANVFDPNGAELGLATFGTQFTDAKISFKITAGGTACVAGDTFVIAAAGGNGAYKLASASAVDGSEVPVAILADYCDPTGGNVVGGIYVMGEFNVNALTFGPGINPAAAKAAMRPLGIFLKNVQTATDPS